MLFSKKNTIKLTVSVILFAISCFFLYRANQIENLNNEPPDNPHGYSDSIVDLSIENDHIIDKSKLSTVKTQLLAQLYKNHYETTKKLESKASIDGEIKQNGNEYSFIIEFKPSHTKYEVKLTMKKLYIKDYDISIKKL